MDTEKDIIIRTKMEACWVDNNCDSAGYSKTRRREERIDKKSKWEDCENRKGIRNFSSVDPYETGTML
jgi:hypothetical protein